MEDFAKLTDFGLCSFSIAGGKASAGLAIDGRVIAVARLLDPHSPGAARLGGSVHAILQEWAEAWPLLKQGAADFRNGPRAGELQALSVPIEAVQLHAPVETPGTIFCAGSNYWTHVVDLHVSRYKPAPGEEPLPPEQIRANAEEMLRKRLVGGEPFYFNKNLTALSGPYDDLVLPGLVTQPDWELELAAVIGKRAWCVSQDDALDHVAGYAIGNDISNRDRLERPGALGLDLLQAKGLAGHFPFGPYLVPAEFVPDPQSLQIVLKLNGKTMQDQNTSDMIYNLRRLIEYLSSWIELQPGDIIATGSPAGNGAHHRRFLQPGDVIESSITGLGTQINHVRPPRPRP